MEADFDDSVSADFFDFRLEPDFTTFLAIGLAPRQTKIDLDSQYGSGVNDSGQAAVDNMMQLQVAFIRQIAKFSTLAKLTQTGYGPSRQLMLH